jgi:hypothetical protein
MSPCKYRSGIVMQFFWRSCERGLCAVFSGGGASPSMLGIEAFVSSSTSWFKYCFALYRTATGGKRLSEEDYCGQVDLRGDERGV